LFRLFSTSFKEEGRDVPYVFYQEIQRLRKLERRKTGNERWESLGRMVEEMPIRFAILLSPLGIHEASPEGLPSSPKANPTLNRSFTRRINLRHDSTSGRNIVHIPKPVFEEKTCTRVSKQPLQFLFSKKRQSMGFPEQVEGRMFAKMGTCLLTGRW